LPNVVCDAGSTSGGFYGPLNLRFSYYTDSTISGYLTDTSSIPNLNLNQSAFGAGYASAPAGPGQANLLTGNLQLSAEDVSLPGGTVSRTFESRNQNAMGSVFGPGWTSNVMTRDSDYRVLTDNGDDVVITASDGTEVNFRKQSDGSYQAQDGSTPLTLTKTSSTVFTLTLLNFDTYTFTNIDASDPNVFQPTAVLDSSGLGASSVSWIVSRGRPIPTQMVAPTTAGVTCTSPLTTRGCMTLTFSYATSTTASGTAEAQWGDYVGQLQTVHYTAWDDDLGTPAMHTGASTGPHHGRGNRKRMSQSNREVVHKDVTRSKKE
jgi:hypothetical protein